MKKALFVLLVLFSVSFPSLLWEYSAKGEVTTKPLPYLNSIFASSSDGSVYLINPSTGKTTWEKKLSGTPTHAVLFQGKPALATTTGTVYLLGEDGNPVMEVNLKDTDNVSYVYGIDAASRIFAATDKGVFSLGAGGDVISVYSSSQIKSPPVIAGNSVLFGEGKNLVKISNAGIVEWKRDIGGSWLARPVVDGSVVYMGGLDKKMHAFFLNTGAERWSVETDNWVVSTPVVKGGLIFFGSNDGAIYSVDKANGRILWSTNTPLAIQTKPEPGLLGGKEVIYVGSTDSNIYALDLQTGDIIWKGSAKSWVSDPLFFQNHVIFGSHDSSVYAYSTERSCSIITPSEGDVLGLKEVKITGNAVSQAGSLAVDVQINDRQWEAADIDGEEWVYYSDPSETMRIGVNEIRCRVSDAAGVETGKFTEVGIVHDSSIPLSNLIVTTKGMMVEGEQFEIFVNDGEDGSPVERFELMLDGQSLSGNASVNVTVPSSGRYTLTAKKIGYNDAVLSVDISSNGVNPLYIGALVLLIVIIAWQIYARFIKK